MESQKRPRSDDNDNDTSISKKFPRIATPIRSETKEAVKRLLSERKKKAERVEIKKFDEIQILEELKKRIAKIDENLHCEVEIISGHPSSAVLCVFPSREKSFNDTIGSFQPVRYLFTPSGHYKFQVFIHRTIAEGKIDIESFAELSVLLDKLRKTSGYQMCPGIKDFDEILEDVRMQPATVKEELWPWRHVGAKSCQLWHKPRDCFVQRDEAERELDGVCSNCKKVRRKLKILQAKRKDLVDSDKARRQEASSKVKICHLSPASQQARELNVRRERKNYRREAERLRTSTALTVSEEQSKELAKLIDCISSSEEGQEAVKAVCNEADEQQPGSGAILKELWELEREAFFKDQRGNATGKTGNRWSPATIRVALAIYSRSPAAFRAVRSLGILQLPCSKEIRRIIGKNADGPGINEVYLQKQSNLFKQFCKETMNAGKREPLGVGALIWDETKVQSKIVWNSMSSKITGYAMSPEEIPWLHDVFTTVQDDFDERKTSYILQFLWRDLTSSFDVIGPYFTCAGSWDHQFLLECVFRTLQVFTLYNFKVRVFVCDGASANLALIKLLCGYKREQLPLCDGEDPFAVTASFQNPYEDHPKDKRVFVVVCPSHQLKNTIAALYSSRPGGTKLFTKDGVEFGWQPIIDQYERDQERAKQNLARRVPGLKYNFVHRDNWTRLNVLPAKIMQQRYMISALQEHARQAPQPADAALVEMTANYLQACHLIFEKGILSHLTITERYQQVLENIKKGFSFFTDWSLSHQRTVYQNNSNKERQKKFLAWQTWDLMRIMVYGFTQFCTWFVERHPEYFIAPLRINGSGIESIFSLFKFCAAGNLSANNYGSIRGRVITGKEVVSNSNSERGYRDDRILVSGNLKQSETSAGSRVAYSVRVVFDPFGLDRVKEFRFSYNLCQSSIGGQQGSNACTLIALLVGYRFVTSSLPQLTRSTLPSLWFEAVTSGMLQGNAIHDVLFDGQPINLDVEDAVECCGDDLHISSYEESIGYDLRLGDLSPLVATLEDRASLRKNQTAVLINNDMTVAVLLWETGECAIIDSHAHGNYGAVISCVPPGQINTIVSWLAKMVLKYFNRVLGLCTLTFVSCDCT